MRILAYRIRTPGRAVLRWTPTTNAGVTTEALPLQVSTGYALDTCEDDSVLLFPNQNPDADGMTVHEAICAGIAVPEGPLTRA